MGLVRTILALCVAAFHSFSIGGLSFTGGKVSVQCFYIISGFYMALILNEKYLGESFSYLKFIKSRIIRIYPAYFIVMILSFFISLGCLYFWNNPLYLGLFKPHWKNLSFTTQIILVFENLFLIGQDILFFLKVNFSSGNLEPSISAFTEKKKLILNGFLFVPQSWTLSIELCFYFLAPFIVRCSLASKLAIVVISLLARLYFYSQLKLDIDPWTYRFFPFEIALFTAGTLAFQLYNMIDKLKYSKVLGFIMLITVVIIILLYNKIPLGESFKSWGFYLLFSLMLPFIFCFSKNSKIDRLIGELSYPIYLIHHLIMFLLRQYFWSHTENMKWFGISTVILSLFAGVFFYLYVTAPIERYRFRILQKQ
ncbi:MAG: acyltransferase family protein [Bacteroidota bacterium]